jgi:Predicted membrane protein
MQQKQIENTILWYIPALWMCFFIAASVIQMWSFTINDFDFSIFLTQIWRVWNGWDWHAPFTEYYLGMPYWGEHCTPISALLAPLIGPWKSPYALSVLQAISTGFMAFLLPRLVRTIYQQEKGCSENNWLWAAGILLVLFFVFRFVLAPWSRQVHFTTIVTPVLMLAVLYLHQRRWVLMGICCLVVCMAEERAALGIFSLGMYAFLLLEMRKTGIALCAFSSLWFIGASQVWLPYALKMAGTSLHYRFQRYIDIMGHWDKKSFYLFRIVAYSWFLPFLGKKAFLSLLCTAPFLGIVVVSNYPTIWGMNGQYEDLLAIFLLISFCYAIIWLQYNLPQRWQKQILTAGTASIVIVMLATQTGWYNPVVTLARLATSPERTQFAKLHAVLNKLPDFPDNINVWVQSGLGPHIFYPYSRMTADSRRMNQKLEMAFVVISPIVGAMRLNDEDADKKDVAYANAKAVFDTHPDLEKIYENDVVVLYVSHDIMTSNTDFSKKTMDFISALPK